MQLGIANEETAKKAEAADLKSSYEQVYNERT